MILKRGRVLLEIGDTYSLTAAGRLFAQAIMMLGPGVTASFIGILGSSVYDELISQ